MYNFFPIPESEDVRVVCPECKVKQNGIVKYANGPIWVTQDQKADVSRVAYTNVIEGTPYILCCISSCQHLIAGDELEEATRHVVKFPSDLRNPPYAILSQCKSSH
ncbi:hypothetical protein ACFSJU_14950 [Paradesertivirga mongoliensis]|uniref:Uncharacterized protein n=1 Tax=Paradesertivirga mongoliensis TaxID=2100740 RepID=A0ABW4ZPE1_9SPHI